MEMWKYSIILPIILALACDNLEPAETETNLPDDQQVQSKSLLALRADSQIKSLAVWVLTPTDSVFEYSNRNGLTAECRTGQAKIYVAGNVSIGDTPVPRYDTLTTDLARMSVDQISFSSSLVQLLTTGVNEIFVNAPRTICKISIETIENRLTEGAYAGKAITLEKVFIINGIGRFRLFKNTGGQALAPTPGRWWFSPSGLTDAEALLPEGEGYMTSPAMSFSNQSITIAHNSSERLDIELFTGPNSIETDAWAGSGENLGPGQWTPRKTRLVLQCLIDGHRCYYPLTISNLIENHHYQIRRIILTRFGTEYPDQPFDFGTNTAFISLKTWDGILISEII